MYKKKSPDIKWNYSGREHPHADWTLHSDRSIIRFGLAFLSAFRGMDSVGQVTPCIHTDCSCKEQVESSPFCEGAVWELAQEFEYICCSIVSAGNRRCLGKIGPAQQGEEKKYSPSMTI